jgi:anthranilate synthase component I
VLPSDNYRIIQLTDTKVDFLQLYQLNPSFYPALLESVSTEHSTKGTETAFDILFFDPQETLYLDSHQELFFNDNMSDIKKENNNFLKTFNCLWQNQNKQQKEKKINQTYYPFSGGWFVFLAYELSKQIEPALRLKQFDPQLPIAYACRYHCALIYDHNKKELVLFSEQKNKIETYIKRIKEDIVKASSKQLSISGDYDLKKMPNINQEPQQKYLHAVEKIKQYIVDGDVFQVNLSRVWQMNIEHKHHHKLACDLYQRLRKTNPAPFSALVNLQGNSVLSSSPERLVKVKNNRVESRPIAGTRPRGKTLAEDHFLIKQLHAHPKEQSEHVMLIDLIRNDLGRVCTPGSIHVDEFMINETYQYVHHIVSNVVGELAANTQPGDVIRAVFPGGTITGCPKIRCMDIIAELEQSARGAYTGSLGYINNDGSMDLNILIRTMLLQSSGLDNTSHKLSVRAGAGIVADSIADKELLETFAKAKGIIKAINN